MKQQRFRPHNTGSLSALPAVLHHALPDADRGIAACGNDISRHRSRPGRGQGHVRLADLMWILASESTAYIVGALSWIFAERTGFLAYARYMLRFARDNARRPSCWATRRRASGSSPSSPARRSTCISHLLYEIEGDLRILLAIILNVIVLGTQIDGSLPIAYAAVFAALFLMQWSMRKRCGQRLPRKPAHDQPHDGAGLHRMGQRVRRQPLQTSGSGSAASRASSATVSMPRSRRS